MILSALWRNLGAGRDAHQAFLFRDWLQSGTGTISSGGERCLLFRWFVGFGCCVRLPDIIVSWQCWHHGLITNDHVGGVGEKVRRSIDRALGNNRVSVIFSFCFSCRISPHVELKRSEPEYFSPPARSCLLVCLDSYRLSCCCCVRPLPFRWQTRNQLRA